MQERSVFDIVCTKARILLHINTAHAHTRKRAHNTQHHHSLPYTEHTQNIYTHSKLCGITVRARTTTVLCAQPSWHTRLSMSKAPPPPSSQSVSVSSSGHTSHFLPTYIHTQFCCRVWVCARAHVFMLHSLCTPPGGQLLVCALHIESDISRESR